MAYLKSETNLTEEELIQLAKKAKVVLPDLEGSNTYYPIFSPINLFLTNLKIGPGKIPIKTKDLYDFYILFTKQDIPRRKFALELSKVLKKSSVHYYLINKTKEEIEQQLEKLQYVKD